ncbi:MAG: N-acetyltransferase [Magnetospirillum sp.]|nr:N-acetyltransferase [Magnetospirillum sp.]
MMAVIAIRAERTGDGAGIDAITRAAFRDHPHSRQTEHLIVRALRAAGTLSLSLVAEAGSTVVGHLAASPVVMGDGSPGWHGLGPLSVAPAWQRQGIGQRLMRQGLERLRQMGSQGCVLVGDPAYYARFGFAAVAGVEVAGVPPEVVLCLSFGDPPPPGAVAFDPAFGVNP